jgi:hypothetical protein
MFGHTQAPAVQLWPAAQALPHAPQLAVAAKSTQAPLHRLSGALHELTAVWHTPSAQVCPEAQAWPHAPQLAGSDCVSWQEPSATVPVAIAPVPAPPLTAGAAPFWPG